MVVLATPAVDVLVPPGDCWAAAAAIYCCRITACSCSLRAFPERAACSCAAARAKCSIIAWSISILSGNIWANCLAAAVLGVANTKGGSAEVVLACRLPLFGVACGGSMECA